MKIKLVKFNKSNNLKNYHQFYLIKQILKKSIKIKCKIKPLHRKITKFLKIRIRISRS